MRYVFVYNTMPLPTYMWIISQLSELWYVYCNHQLWEYCSLNSLVGFQICG